MHLRDLHSDVLGSDTFDVVYESLADLFMILVGYQTARDLSISLGGKDSLRAFALVSAPNTADVEGRTAAITLERVVALLTEEVIYVEELLVCLFIEGDLTDHLTLFGRQVDDLVIEARDGDTAVLVLNLGDELTEFVDGVSDSTAEVTGVKVVIGTRHFDLPVGKTT